jgi:hypothetical protein
LVAADGSAIYYWPDGYGLYKYTFSTNAHTAIGGTSARPGPVACNNGSDVSLHINRGSDSGIIAKLCNLSTGVQTTLTVSGDTLPTGLICYGVEYVASLGKYVSVWINSAAWNTPSATISSIYVVTLTVSGSAATAAVQTMTGTAPTKAGSYCGMGYDPTYGCVLLHMDRTQLIEAFKVS